jgi:hypothetical protein
VNISQLLLRSEKFNDDDDDDDDNNKAGSAQFPKSISNSQILDARRTKQTKFCTMDAKLWGHL